MLQSLAQRLILRALLKFYVTLNRRKAFTSHALTQRFLY